MIMWIFPDPGTKHVRSNSW